jgi:cell division inhibitor SulA
MWASNVSNEWAQKQKEKKMMKCITPPSRVVSLWTNQCGLPARSIMLVSRCGTALCLSAEVLGWAGLLITMLSLLRI